MVWNPFKKKQPKPTLPEVTEEVEAVAEEHEGPSGIAANANPILRHFHVSEKGTRGLALNQYTFVVDQRATKTQVRDAVRRGYKVDVVGVQMVRLPSKQRRYGRHEGRVPGRKKAIVTLKEGQTIAAAQP
jgi:large subunit ribosomal protein L23